MNIGKYYITYLKWVYWVQLAVGNRKPGTGKYKSLKTYEEIHHGDKMQKQNTEMWFFYSYERYEWEYHFA